MREIEVNMFGNVEKMLKCEKCGLTISTVALREEEYVPLNILHRLHSDLKKRVQKLIREGKLLPSKCYNIRTGREYDVININARLVDSETREVMMLLYKIASELNMIVKC